MTTRKDLNEYKWDEFFKEFQDETPRAAVIISGAFLDTLLRDLLASFMVDDPKAVDELLGSEKDAEKPLGTFGGRISATYCLGLISPHECHDLKIIKKIRNKFAHKFHGYSFDDPEIVKLCDLLKAPSILGRTSTSGDQSHRRKYLSTIALLVNQLGIRILSIQHNRRVITKDVEVLQVVVTGKEKDK